MPTEAQWTGIARDQLLGRKIVSVRYMHRKEMADFGWTSRPVVIELDDGNLVFPAQDEEGNGAGVLFTQNPKNHTLPTMR
jgi:hypothetical protein